MKKHCIIFLLIMLYESNLFCQTIKEYKIEGTYTALNTETFWIYKFSSNRMYKYEIKGHIANATTIGEYRVSNDTIILAAFPRKWQPNQDFYFKNDTLIIDRDDCLINLSDGLEFLRTNPDDTIFVSRRRNLKLPGRPVIH